MEPSGGTPATGRHNARADHSARAVAGAKAPTVVPADRAGRAFGHGLEDTPEAAHRRTSQRSRDGQPANVQAERSSEFQRTARPRRIARGRRPLAFSRAACAREIPSRRATSRRSTSRMRASSRCPPWRSSLARGSDPAGARLSGGSMACLLGVGCLAGGPCGPRSHTVPESQEFTIRLRCGFVVATFQRSVELTDPPARERAQTRCNTVRSLGHHRRRTAVRTYVRSSRCEPASAWPPCLFPRCPVFAECSRCGSRYAANLRRRPLTLVV